MDYFAHLKDVSCSSGSVRRLPFSIWLASVYDPGLLIANRVLYLRSRSLWRELLNAWLVDQSLDEFVDPKVPNFSCVDTLLHVADDGRLLINFFFLDAKMNSGAMMVIEADEFDVARVSLGSTRFLVRVFDQSMDWVDDVPAEVVYGAAKLVLYSYGERLLVG